jgi:hypothetical protein
MAMGRPLRVLAEADCRRLAPSFATPDNLAGGHFRAVRRLLDREEPDYRH